MSKLSKAHVEKQKRWYEKSRKTAYGYCSIIYIRAKMNARRKKIEFNITFEDIFEKIEKGYCEVTNIPFEYTGVRYNPFAPSIDKIDPTKGYTKDNIQVVCLIYNRAKGINHHRDVIKMVRALSWELEKIQVA